MKRIKHIFYSGFLIFWMLLNFKSLGQQNSDLNNISPSRIYQFVHLDRGSEENITLNEEQISKLRLAQRKEKSVYIRITEKTFVKLLSKSLTQDNELSIPTEKIFIIEDSDYLNFKPVGLDEAVLENKE